MTNSIRNGHNEIASRVLSGLTGTAPRGGLGVWILSQKQVSLTPIRGVFVAREAAPKRSFLAGIGGAMVGPWRSLWQRCWIRLWQVARGSRTLVLWLTHRT